jgi:hypothetical protein
MIGDGEIKGLRRPKIDQTPSKLENGMEGYGDGSIQELAR